MKSISEKKMGVLLSYVLLIADTLISLVYTPILLRSLGDSEYGLYQLMISTVSYFAIMDLGLGSSITRYMVMYRAKNDKEGEVRFFSMAMVVYGIIGLIIAVLSVVVFSSLGAIFRGLTTGEIVTARVLFIIMVINLIISLFDHAFTGALVACEKFTFEKSIKIARVFTRAIAVIILLQFYKSAVVISLVEIVLTATILLIKACVCVKELHIRIVFEKIDMSLLKEVFVFTSAILIQTIANQFNNNVDKTVLGIFSTTSAIAVYSIAIQLNSAFSGLSTAVQAVYLPSISKIVFEGKDDEAITESLILPSRIQLIILALVFGGFVWFGKEFIHLWCGKDEAWLIACIIMAASMLELFQNCTTSVLKAKNKLHGRTMILVATAVGNFIITILLVPKYGMLGAAAGTVFTMILGYSIGNNLYYHYVIGIKLKKFFAGVFKGILPAILLSYAFGGVIYFLIPGMSWLLLFVKLLVYSAGYVVFMFAMGLSPSEKKKVIRIRNRK